MKDLINYITAQNEKTVAWVNEDPTNRWATITTVDEAHWTELGITDVASYKRFVMEGDIWEMYKSVNGVRPRWVNFDEMSDAELVEMYDSLVLDLEAESKREAFAQEEAVKAFEASIANLIEMGAPDRETAIKWLKDAENDEDMSDDYFEYINELPYGYTK